VRVIYVIVIICEGGGTKNFIKWLFMLPTYKPKKKQFKIKPTMINPDTVIVEMDELKRHLKEKIYETNTSIQS